MRCPSVNTTSCSSARDIRRDEPLSPERPAPYPHLADPATRRSLRIAADATHRLGLGWNHTACHGDLGAWELLERAAALGEGPDGMAPDSLRAAMLTGLEEHGPVCGIVRDALVPGLLAGVGSVAYQLLRWHPESDLPSILTLGGDRF